MWQRFEDASARLKVLEQQLSDPALLADRTKHTQVAKEFGSLTKLVEPYRAYCALTQEIEHAEGMVAAERDPEMKQYAVDELTTLQVKHQQVVTQLEDLLLVDPNEDFGSVIVEIRAGVGGEEAALFARELYDMYAHYARAQHWKVEEIDFSPSEKGGFKAVVFSVTGDDAFSKLRYESGGHRVQRVPQTEQQGRIHTSAATVAIMPEPDSVQIEVKDEEIEWERMRAGGAGGQHVNKTESAVRIWYKRGTSEEMEVKCQDERSQHKNFDQAMRVLRGRLFERKQQQLHSARAEQRRTLIGSGDRSERIRTYNFPQGRVTDHRINVTLYKLESVMAGNLGELIQALKDFDKKQRLSQAK